MRDRIGRLQYQDFLRLLGQHPVFLGVSLLLLVLTGLFPSCPSLQRRIVDFVRIHWLFLGVLDLVFLYFFVRILPR